MAYASKVVVIGLFQRREYSLPEKAGQLLEEHSASYFIAKGLSAFLNTEYQGAGSGPLEMMVLHQKHKHGLKARVRATFKDEDLEPETEKAITAAVWDLFETALKRGIAHREKKGLPIDPKYNPFSPFNIDELAAKYLENPIVQKRKVYARLARAFEIEEQLYQKAEQDAEAEKARQSLEKDDTIPDRKTTSAPVDTDDTQPYNAPYDEHSQTFSMVSYINEMLAQSAVEATEGREDDTIPETTAAPAATASPIPPDPEFTRHDNTLTTLKTPTRLSLYHPGTEDPDIKDADDTVEDATYDPGDEEQPGQPSAEMYNPRTAPFSRFMLKAAMAGAGVLVALTYSDSAAVDDRPDEGIPAHRLVEDVLDVDDDTSPICEGRILFNENTPNRRQLRRGTLDDTFEDPEDFQGFIEEAVGCAIAGNHELYLTAHLAEGEWLDRRGRVRRDSRRFASGRAEIVARAIREEASRRGEQIDIMIRLYTDRTVAFGEGSENATVTLSTQGYLPDPEGSDTTHQDLEDLKAMVAGMLIRTGRVEQATIYRTAEQQLYVDAVRAGEIIDTRFWEYMPEESRRIAEQEMLRQERQESRVAAATAAPAPPEPTVTETAAGPTPDEETEDPDAGADEYDQYDSGIDAFDDGEPQQLVSADISDMVRRARQIARQCRQGGDTPECRALREREPEDEVPDTGLPRETAYLLASAPDDPGDSLRSWLRNPYADDDTPDAVEEGRTEPDAGIGTTDAAAVDPSSIETRLVDLQRAYAPISREIDAVTGVAQCRGIPQQISRFYDLIEEVESPETGQATTEDREEADARIAELTPELERLRAQLSTGGAQSCLGHLYSALVRVQEFNALYMSLYADLDDLMESAGATAELRALGERIEAFDPQAQSLIARLRLDRDARQALIRNRGRLE